NATQTAAIHPLSLHDALPISAENLRSHDIAERQRRFEQGAYLGTPHLLPNSGLSNGIAGAHMVVTHDLPRFDRIHLSAEAQLILAERVALAYQEHVLRSEEHTSELQSRE